MLIQTELEMLEEIPETIQTEDEKLIVFVEVRKPRCFKCDTIEHLRIQKDIMFYARGKISV